MPVSEPQDSAQDVQDSGCCCFQKKSKPQLLKDSTNTLTKVPFYAQLPKDLKCGKSICIKGRPLQSCIRFSVNLTCGKGPAPDVAFHFNPRLLQRCIVRNSRVNGRWGDEETTSSTKFAFGRNKKFALNIFVGKGEFFVALDGVHICSYTFRVPLTKLTAIEVVDDVEIYGVEYKELAIFPEPTAENKPITVALGRRRDDDATAMDTPVTFLLAEGLQPDWQLEIYGRVKILPHSFYINLQEGPHQWPHPVIPLHLNPRFSTGSTDPLFVRNAWIDGGWGQEERTAGFQFSPGSPFTMAIRRGNDHFSVSIDGKLVGEFKFRGDVRKIDTVSFQGDVVIFWVGLNDKPDRLGN